MKQQKLNCVNRLFGEIQFCGFLTTTFVFFTSSPSETWVNIAIGTGFITIITASVAQDFIAEIKQIMILIVVGSLCFAGLFYFYLESITQLWLPLRSTTNLVSIILVLASTSLCLGIIASTIKRQ